MTTDPLRAVVDDFERQVSRWGWWIDALFVAGASPNGDGTKSWDMRVYLVGPVTDVLAAPALTRSVQDGRLWAMIPYWADAVDLDVFTYFMATRPHAGEDERLNFLAVHVSRHDDASGAVGYRWMHQPLLDQRGKAKELLVDPAWVRDAVASLDLANLSLQPLAAAPLEASHQEAAVGLAVRAGEIRARVFERTRQDASGVDLWVSLESLERHQAVTEITAAASRVSGRVRDLWSVYPTTGGTYVWLDDLTGWEKRVEELAANLERRGHRGFISAAPVQVWPSKSDEHPYPTAVMAHRIEPPVTKGPFNAFGMPQNRWGVPASASEALLGRAAAWVCLPETKAEATAFSPVPVTVDDAAEIVELLLAERARRTRLAARFPSEPDHRRTTWFEPFGRTVWIESDDHADPIHLAENLAQILVGFAADLDVAVIHPAFPGISAADHITTRVWDRNRHLWSSFVPDAFGLQLLTGEHLQRANDLSNWRVEQVAPDRWLVRARDLAAWIALPDASSLRHGLFPDSEVRRRAREDFGEMILTREAAKANPRPTPA